MKKYFVSILLLLLGFSLSAQVEGTVLDLESNEPLPYVDVFFVDLNTGTMTNENGVFRIEHYKRKTIHLQISYLGYETIDSVVTLDSELTFKLEVAHLKLEEVLVTASTGKLQAENIVSIERRKIAELEQTAPISLAETISNIAGVEQNTTGAGIGKPVIRGLSGNRIVTYAQGVRVENQQWGSEHGLGVGEVGIENVEVIKGPASILYGSDALGGVLFFVEERYAKHNTLEANVESKYLSNTKGSISKIGLKLHKEQLKFNLFGAYSSQADYAIPSFDKVFNTRFDEQNLKAALGLNTAHWISNLRYSYLQNNYGISEGADYVHASNRKLELPFQTIDNHSLSVENKIFIGDSELDFVLGYGTNYRREFEEDAVHQALGLKLSTLTYDLKWKSKKYKELFSFVIGSQGMAQTNKNDGEELLIPDATTKDIGLFGMSNLNIGKWVFQGGLRVDHRNINTQAMKTDEVEFLALQKNYTGFSFSLGARYNVNKSTWRANISNGFRAPNTSELLSNGVHEGTNRFEKGNTVLNTEQATQIDFAYTYSAEHFSFGFNPFVNLIQNYIYLNPTNDVIDGNPVFNYLQKDAVLYGGEIGAHYHPHSLHWLHLESNFATVLAEDRNGKSLPLIPQNKLSSTVSVALSQNSIVQLKKIYVQHIYKLKQNRIGLLETATPSYNLVNSGLTVVVKTKARPINISLGVKNVFNTKYIDHLSRFKKLEIPNQGLNVYLGIKFGLTKKLK